MNEGIQLRKHRTPQWQDTVCLLWDNTCKFIYMISVRACSIIPRISQWKSNSSHINRIILVYQICRLCDAVNLPDTTTSRRKYHHSSTRWRTATFPHRSVPASEAISLGKWIGRGEPLENYRPSPDLTPLDSRRMWYVFLREMQQSISDRKSVPTYANTNMGNPSLGHVRTNRTCETSVNNLEVVHHPV
jgi:ribosomal protein L40E